MCICIFDCICKYKGWWEAARGQHPKLFAPHKSCSARPSPFSGDFFPKTFHDMALGKILMSFLRSPSLNVMFQQCGKYWVYWATFANKWKLLCKNEEIKEKDFGIAFSCKPRRMCVVGVRKAVFSAGQLLAAFGSCGDVAKSCRGGRSSAARALRRKTAGKFFGHMQDFWTWMLQHTRVTFMMLQINDSCAQAAIQREEF